MSKVVEFSTIVYLGELCIQQEMTIFKMKQ